MRLQLEFIQECIATLFVYMYQYSIVHVFCIQEYIASLASISFVIRLDIRLI